MGNFDPSLVGSHNQPMLDPNANLEAPQGMTHGQPIGEAPVSGFDPLSAQPGATNVLPVITGAERAGDIVAPVAQIPQAAVAPELQQQAS